MTQAGAAAAARPVRPFSTGVRLYGRGEAAFQLAVLVLAGLFYEAPWAPVYGVALLALVALAVRSPSSALPLVPLFAPLWFQPKHMGHEEFAPSEIFLLVAAVGALGGAGIWRVPATAVQRIWSSPFAKPMALLVIAGGLSTLLAADRHHALQYFRLTVVEPAVYFCLLVIVARRPIDWWLQLGALVAAGVGVGLIGLVQWHTGQDLGQVPGTPIVHLRSVYGSPNNLALLYDRVVPVALAALLLPRMPMWWRAMLTAGGAVLVAALALSASRGAIAALLVACFFLIWLRFRWGRALAGLGLLLLILAVAAERHHISTLLQSGHQGTVSRRVDIWHSSLDMLRDHPVFGIGPDNFLHYYAPRPAKDQYFQKFCSPGLGYIRPSAGDEPCLSHPHDEFLDFALSTGLLGLAAYLWIEVAFWRVAVQLFRSTTTGPARWMLVGVMASMLAAVAHGLVDNSYFLVDLALLFWLLCGYVNWLRAEPEEAYGRAG